MFPQLARDYSPLERAQGARQRRWDGVFHSVTSAQLSATGHLRDMTVSVTLNDWRNGVMQPIPYTLQIVRNLYFYLID